MYNLREHFKTMCLWPSNQVFVANTNWSPVQYGLVEMSLPRLGNRDIVSLLHLFLRADIVPSFKKYYGLFMNSD